MAVLKVVKSPSAAFFPRLQALRGIAALAVAAFHCWQGAWFDASGQLHRFLAADPADTIATRAFKLAGRMLSNGDGAVIIFFVLSGFVLSGSLAHGPRAAQQSAGRFFVARLFRIYPAIVGAILLFAAVYWLTGRSLDAAAAENFSLQGLLRNVLLIDARIDVVMWSLQIEVLAVPLIFAAYFACLRWGIVVLIALCVVLIGLSFSSTWQQAISGVHQFGLIFAFIPGMMAYFLGEPLLRRFSPRAARWILAVAVIAFLATRPVVGPLSNWSVVLESLFGAIVVAALAFSNVDRQNAILDRPVARFYGTISYSFYLLHPLTLLAIAALPALLGNGIHSAASETAIALGLFIGSTLAITPLAYAMYRWIELPGIALGKVVTTATLQSRFGRQPIKQAAK